MIRRSFPRRVSEKRLKANGGKMFSTIRRSSKPIPQVNISAKARRDARYRKVISSPRWKALRGKVWARMQEHAGPSWSVVLCECGCGQTMTSISEMQLAHLTYSRFGHELETDVQGQTKWCNAKEAALRGKRIRRTA